MGNGIRGRQQRGLAIAVLAQEHIRADKFGYKVPSQSGNGVYLVNLDDGPYCTCMDFEKRGLACKHVFAVEALLQRSERLDEEPPQAVRIAQPWAAYNNAQIHEGELFAVLLRSLCDIVPQPPQANGRPRLPLSDMLYGMGLKVYSTLSTRRAMSGIRDAVADGRMGKEPSFSTPIRYFEREDVTPVLRQLIQASALPLRGAELDFAIDSSGFATTAYNRWFEHKWGHVESKKAVKWAKLHVMCGVQSNIITAADATASMSADSPYLADFVRITAENFPVRDVSADMAYSSRKNLHAVADVGGTPYIPFKTGAVAKPKGARGRPVVGADVPPLHPSAGRLQSPLSSAQQRGNLLPHDQGEVRRQAPSQVRHRHGQRGSGKGRVPQHLCPDSSHVRPGHHSRIRRRGHYRLKMTAWNYFYGWALSWLRQSLRTPSCTSTQHGGFCTT